MSMELLRELMKLKELIEIQETVTKHTKKKMAFIFITYSKDCSYRKPVFLLGGLSMCSNNKRGKRLYLTSAGCTVDTCPYLKTL